ncbi:MAG TPA: enoyl-CoA hydratase-related protein [Acidimicrobiales bacterium]
MSSSDPSNEELVLFSVEGRIATVTLNRPDMLNAVSTPVLRRLFEVFDEVNNSEDIWCVIFKGNGRAFCTGADQKERATMTEDDIRYRRRVSPQSFAAMRNCRRPVIAQIHGYALGGGLELALGCDLIVAAKGTTMGLIETSKGSIPAGGGTQILPRLVGLQRAKEIIFTSMKFTAEDALSWGMLNYVVPAEELDAKVSELANAIVSVAPISNIQAKKAINCSTDLDIASGVQMETALYERTLTTSDRREALTAAREKRKPEFKGA